MFIGNTFFKTRACCTKICAITEREIKLFDKAEPFFHTFSSSQCAVHSVAMVTNRILGRRRSSESRAKVVDKADRVTLQRHSCSSRLQHKETHGRVPSDIRKVSSDKRSPPDTGARCSPWRVPTCAAHAGALWRSASQLSCARPAFPELLAAGSNFPIPNCPWNFQPLQKYQFLSQLRSSVPVAQQKRCNLHSQVQLPRPELSTLKLKSSRPRSAAQSENADHLGANELVKIENSACTCALCGPRIWVIWCAVGFSAVMYSCV